MFSNWFCRFGCSLAVMSNVVLTPARGEDKAPKQPTKSRKFEFTYATTITGLPPGKMARIWLPVPPSNDEQQIKIKGKDLPEKNRISPEPKYGNDILYAEARAGEDGTVALSVTYEVIRQEVRADLRDRDDAVEDFARFLRPDAKVPIGGKPLDLIKDKKLPEDQLAMGQLFYEMVNGHMRYSKEGNGWGRGDAVWACDSKYGNCTDFHSLFISLARSHKIPAKFEMGFPLPEKRGEGEIPGYHCWAKFRPAGKGWVPVDISEANKNPKMKEYYFGNLTEDRISFTTGRDLTLVPKQAGEPLNFFIYPYVEVDGKVFPADKVKRKFTFKDMK